MPINPLPVKVQEQNQDTEKNLAPEAKVLLGILDELEDFTTKLRKRIISELKPELTQEADKKDAAS